MQLSWFGRNIGTMNTMPQAFDPRPMPRTGISVAVPGSRVARARTESHLKLVVDAADLPAAERRGALSTEPYGLNGRRHLAGVAAPHDPQAVTQPEDAGLPRPVARRALEPLAFALVLLAGVAALAMALRAA